jgi:hypothetical protein
MLSLLNWGWCYFFLNIDNDKNFQSLRFYPCSNICWNGIQCSWSLLRCLYKTLLLLLYLRALGQQFLFVSILPSIQRIEELERRRHILYKPWEEVWTMWKWFLCIGRKCEIWKPFKTTLAFLAQIGIWVCVCLIQAAFFTLIYVKWI